MKPTTFFLKIMLCLPFAILVFTSCKKGHDAESVTTEIAEAKTNGDTTLVALSVSASTETITAITLKNESTGFSGNVHVKLSLNAAAVAASPLTPMPAGSYTLATMEYDVPANGTVTVPITINKSLLTVDNTYGISFKMETVSNGSIGTNNGDMMVKIGMRNRWDGRYKVTGTMTDLFAPAFVFMEHETQLITTTATQVKMIPTLLGIPGYLIKNGINTTFYGSFGPVINFDATTNNITSIINYYGQPAPNTRSAELDASGTNNWNPTSKNITIKFWMNEPSSITPHRCAFNNTWVYLGPR